MLASLFPWVLYLLACLSTAYFVYYGAAFWPTFLLHVVFFNGGIQGLWAAMGHLFFPKETAKSIGWESCGFQTEIGATNLAIGVAGVLCIFNPDWSIPVGLILAIFFSGCAYIHIKERIQLKNNAPCNSGPMLYNTIVVVISLYLSIVLSLLFAGTSKL